MGPELFFLERGADARPARAICSTCPVAAPCGAVTAEQGLLHPIVLDDEHRVLDGRNRLAACETAGVTPTVTVYDGPDADTYALTVNASRRHIKKGQIAMVAARACSVSEQAQRDIASTVGVSNGLVGNAATVLDHAPDLADGVVSGAVPLDTAYEQARGRKQAAKAKADAMSRLHADAPDLAEQVQAELGPSARPAPWRHRAALRRATTGLWGGMSPRERMRGRRAA